MHENRFLDIPVIKDLKEFKEKMRNDSQQPLQLKSKNSKEKSSQEIFLVSISKQ